MKKIFTVSLVAIMAATAANADIASTKYVTDITGNTTFTGSIAESADLTVAVNALAGKVDTVAGEGEGSVAEQIEDALTSYTNTEGMNSAISTAVSGAKQELTTEIGKVEDKADANTEAISKLDQTYATDTALTDGLALKQDIANMKDSLVGLTSDQKKSLYPTIALMETQISDANNEMGDTVDDLTKLVNTNESDIEGKVSALTTTVTNNKNAADDGIQEAKDAAAQALTDAKAYADSQGTAQTTAITTAYQAADLALKTELEGKITSAAGDASEVAGDLAEYISSNDTAVEAAQAAADAAQGEVDALEGVVETQKTDLQEAISDGDAATLASAKEDATTKANAAQAAAEATAAADATTKANAALAEAKSYADTAEADAKTYGDDTFQVKSSALSVGAANGAWTDLTAATGYSTTGTHSLVLKNGVIQWELVDYGDNQ